VVYDTTATCSVAWCISSHEWWSYHSQKLTVARENCRFVLYLGYICVWTVCFCSFGLIASCKSFTVKFVRSSALPSEIPWMKSHCLWIRGCKQVVRPVCLALEVAQEVLELSFLFLLLQWVLWALLFPFVSGKSCPSLCCECHGSAVPWIFGWSPAPKLYFISTPSRTATVFADPHLASFFKACPSPLLPHSPSSCHFMIGPNRTLRSLRLGWLKERVTEETGRTYARCQLDWFGCL